MKAPTNRHHHRGVPDGPHHQHPAWDPSRSLYHLADVELLTADWVLWYNTDRLIHRLGRIPPIEYEHIYYATNTAQPEAAHQ